MASGRYKLAGSAKFPQVEPPVAFWLRSPVPRAVSLEEVRRELDHVVPEYDLSNSTAGMQDLAAVKRLSDFGHSHDPAFFAANEQLSAFLVDQAYLVDSRGMPRIPFGAVINWRTPFYQPFLKYGAELARLFEAETPGLWHRHILNVLLDPTVPSGFGQKLSPPRQALIWAALDVAISSALQSAWYFKWFNLSGSRISFRERPWEADNTTNVLYDYNIAFDANGNIIRGSLRNDPMPTPGTPRHPAYPSGHSTYSAAASAVLGCLFPTYRTSFSRLANNIGRARLWAGVHWMQDHMTGQLVGKTVGELVIRQLNTSGIRVKAVPDANVPDDAKLRQLEREFYETWRTAKDFCGGIGFFAAEAGRRVEEEEGLMNATGAIEPSERGSRDLPPADTDGQLDVERLRRK